MNNWKTTIGGALSALGTSIAGIATVSAFTEPDYKKLAVYCIIAGALLSAFGKFFGLLFAQDKPADDPTGPKIRNIVGVVLLLGLLGLGATGCASLQPGADPVVVRSEQSLVVATATFDTFLKLDHANRALVQAKAPAVHAFAEWLRVPVPFKPGSTVIVARWAALVESAELTKLAYKQNRTPENKANLVTAMATLDTALTQTEAQLAELQTLNLNP